MQDQLPISKFLDSPYLDTPFVSMLLGLSFWFVGIWSIGRNKGKWEKTGGFWKDQKDEFVVALVAGLIFVIIDDEAVNIYNLIFDKEVEEIQHYWYLVVCPVVERTYHKLFG